MSDKELAQKITPIIVLMNKICQPLCVKTTPYKYTPEEEVDPELRGAETKLVKYVFDYYLRSYNPSNWMDKVFNKGILQKDFGATMAFEMLYPTEFYLGTPIDKENMFWVRNFELFDCHFARLLGFSTYIKYAQATYEKVRIKNRWIE